MQAINVSGGGEPSMGRTPPLRYPNTDRILSGDAGEPYTLETFVDYLSENHCIELLDFLSETKTYIDAYRASAPDICATKMTSDSRRLGKQWKSLMSTYITPGAPDELNFPQYIRATLLDRTNVMILPPSPAVLEPAMRYAHEMLTESALMPFIQSIRLSGNHINRNNVNGRNNMNGRNNVNGQNNVNGRNNVNGQNNVNGRKSLSPSSEPHGSGQINLRAISGPSSNTERDHSNQVSGPIADDPSVQDVHFAEGERGSRKWWRIPSFRLKIRFLNRLGSRLRPKPSGA